MVHLFRRGLARVADLLAALALAALISAPIFAALGVPGPEPAARFRAAVGWAAVFYLIICPGYRLWAGLIGGGATPGLRVAGLVIVAADGGIPSAGRLLMRLSIATWLADLTLFGHLLGLWSPGLTLVDRLSGTRVVCNHAPRGGCHLHLNVALIGLVLGGAAFAAVAVQAAGLGRPPATPVPLPGLAGPVVLPTGSAWMALYGLPVVLAVASAGRRWRRARSLAAPTTGRPDPASIGPARRPWQGWQRRRRTFRPTGARSPRPLR